MSNNSDTFYYNALITGGNEYVIGAVYNDTRTTTICEDVSQYKLALVNMVVPTQMIPLRVMEVERDPIKNPNNINMLIHRIQLKCGSETVEEPIIWITPSPLVPVPQFVTRDAIIDTKYYLYYSLWNYTYLYQLINTTFAVAFEKLKKITNIVSTQPPIFTYNSLSQVIEIVVQESYETDGIRLLFSDDAYVFVNRCFPTSFGQLGSIYYNEILIDYNILNKIAVPQPYGACIKNEGDYNVLGLFYTYGGFRSIEVSSSNTLMCQNEYIQDQNPNTGKMDTTGNSFSSILCDFKVDITNGFEIYNNVVYNPTAQFRYISFTQAHALRTFNFSVFWKDSYGNRYPLVLRPGTVFQSKWLFEKKNNIV